MEVCRDFELISVIVNNGIGSKVIKIAKKNGISGGTVFLGRGTIKNRILEYLDLADCSKEIVLIVSDKHLVDEMLKSLNKELSLHKPNHGIAFTMDLSNVLGARTCNLNNIIDKRGEGLMYNAIFTVVEKGNAENVIEAANKAGARGGTIINARGSGIHETNKLFSMAIEPEKEIVLILSESNITNNIVASIEEQLKIDEPGHGILFVLDVNKTCGLY